VNNILFFGATGRLGKNWVKYLVKNYKVYANVRKNKKLSLNKNLIQINFDLNKKKQILTFCNRNKISIIINCIGLADVELCQYKPKQSLKVNYFIPSELCKIARKLNILFVHISTDMLFDGKSKRKYTEYSKYKPINIYSATKVKAEKYILKYNKSLIIRANFFGFSEKNNPTISDKLISQQTLNKKTYLWNDVYFTPIYIPNLIFFINLLIKFNSTGIYNVSSDECISKYKFGLKVIKGIVKKNQIFPNNLNKRKFVNRPKNMCLCNKKIVKKFQKYKYKLKLRYQMQLFLKDFKLIKYG